MNFCKSKKQKVWSIIIVIYNLLGLIGLLGTYPDDPFFSKEMIYLELFTFPITVVGSAYRYVHEYPVYPVFIIQGIILIISLLAVNLLIKKADS